MTNAAAGVPDGPLWRFALELYAREGVAECCLALQDEAGVDVLAIILVVYAGLVADRPLSAPRIQAMTDAVEHWRTGVVVPLRSVRRALRQDASEVAGTARERLLSEVKAAERLAEQIQLGGMERWLHALPREEGLPPRDGLRLLLPPAPASVRQRWDERIESLSGKAAEAAEAARR